MNATIRSEDTGSRLAHLLPLVLAAILVGLPSLPLAPLDVRVFPSSAAISWFGTLCVALGLGFAIWARLFLGKNWSGRVTIKRDHELTITGPYRLVRHPIYTGILVAFIGCAIARGEVRGLLAAAIVGVSLWRKLRIEERWLTGAFGEAYGAYQKRVAALVPGLLCPSSNALRQFAA